MPRFLHDLRVWGAQIEGAVEGYFSPLDKQAQAHLEQVHKQEEAMRKAQEAKDQRDYALAQQNAKAVVLAEKHRTAMSAKPQV